MNHACWDLRSSWLNGSVQRNPQLLPELPLPIQTAEFEENIDTQLVATIFRLRLNIVLCRSSQASKRIARNEYPTTKSLICSDMPVIELW
jgi:hypothetical protein